MATNNLMANLTYTKGTSNSLPEDSVPLQKTSLSMQPFRGQRTSGMSRDNCSTADVRDTAGCMVLTFKTQICWHHIQGAHVGSGWATEGKC